MNRNEEEREQNALYLKTPITILPPAFSTLEVGKHLGTKVINSVNDVHQKDILLEYEENGERCSTIVFNTANNHLGGWSYQVNSIMVVNEKEEKGKSFESLLADCHIQYGFLDQW